MYNDRKVITSCPSYGFNNNYPDWSNYEECTEYDNYYDIENSDYEAFENSINDYQEDERKIEKEKEKFATAHKIFTKVLQENQIVYDGHRFYKIDIEKCYYKKLQDNELECYIASLFDLDVRGRISVPCMRNVVEALRREMKIKLDFKQFKKVSTHINLSNCVYDIESGNTYKNSLEYGFDSCLNACYISESNFNKAPNFKAFIESSLDGDEEKTTQLLQAIGYIICNWNKAKKAIFLIGEANSGKSIILKFLIEVIGKEHVANIPFHKLGEKFYLAALSDAKVNISSEIKNVKSKHLDTFKALVGGGDSLLAEQKGQDPYFFEAKVKLIFAGNILPQISEIETTSAFIDRLVVVHFPKSIPKEKQDPNLFDKLIQEKDTIISLALKALKELYAKGFIFEEPISSKPLLDKLKISENSVCEFINDFCEIDPGAKICSQELFAQYRKYCEENVLEVMSLTRFHQAMESVKGVKRSKFRLGSSNPRHGYKGIKISDISKQISVLPKLEEIHYRGEDK